MPKQRSQGEQKGLDISGGVSAFERIKREDEAGEYWLARELAALLGYAKWQHFNDVIEEAKEVCRSSGGGSTEGMKANG